MTGRDRHVERMRRHAAALRGTIGEEFRSKRLSAGLTQAQVAIAAGLSRPSYVRVEAGTRGSTTLDELVVIAAVLGLDMSVRVFPGGEPVRDVAQARRLERLIGVIVEPLHVRTEVPLPRTTDRSELRAWDAVITGVGRRTAIEVEMRLHDAQAVERRLALKRRDDPVDAFLLVLAATKHNRRVLRDFPGLFPDLPRIDPRRVLSALRAGRHPGTGVVLL